MVNWTLAIPIDNIKSRIQATHGATVSALVRGVWQEGIRGVFSGLGPALFRAFPASAALFFGVEASNRAMHSMSF